MKNTPAPKPSCVAVNPIAWFIVNPAKPTLLRSR